MGDAPGDLDLHDQPGHVDIMATAGDSQPFWSVYCGRCEQYGPLRDIYEDALADGHTHADCRLPLYDDGGVRR